MKNSVVLVTGGSGFIGSHLVERLLKNGNEVHVFDITPLEQSMNLKEVKDHPGLHYFQGDLRKKEDIEAFWVPEAKVMYHLASVVGIKNYIADPLKLIDIVVIGTRYLLEVANKYGTKVVFSSTSEVFGKNPAVPWREDGDRVLGPTYVDRWSYSASKGVCEQMFYGNYKHTQLPFSIVRFFNVYGPRQNPYFLMSQSIYKVLNGQQPLLYDDGRMTRCFTYVDDIVDGLVIVGDHEKAIGEAFNLGNSVEVSVREVIETVLRETGSEIGYQVFDTQEVYGKKYEDIIRRVPDVQKAYQVLGWKATIQIEEGIRRIIDWAKKNEWWLSQKNG